MTRAALLYDNTPYRDRRTRPTLHSQVVGMFHRVSIPLAEDEGLYPCVLCTIYMTDHSS